MNQLRINMFGDFSISYGSATVSSTGNHSRKVWLLIAYLVYNRNRVVTIKELIDLLWNDHYKDINYNGSLKTLLYRARIELDGLFDNAGKKLIVYNGEGYSWNNTECLTTVDYNEFELVVSDLHNRDIQDVVVAMELFCGDFLETMSSEFWVIPIAAHYRNLFVESLREIIPLLIEKSLFESALQFCQMAVTVEPYSEEVHCLYMKVALACGKKKKAIEIYQKLSERLLTELGVLTSEASRSLYHEAMKTTNTSAITIDILQSQLREASDRSGALVCGYDFFKVLYYSMARSIFRNGFAVHIALISVVDKKDVEPKRLEKIMVNVEDLICILLRRGDTVARCSSSQYVIMLPRANFENSCMVCERIIRAFNKKHSYSDIELHYAVCPIEPDDKECFLWPKGPVNN